ncbi:B12-binding domain-containing radical SAM protein [Candidatus Micrarchaeota archaeon]|nr:B12-binding domain-containing radical SAM protein [Candidatus Micrarchaeota archaeon]
MNKHIPPEVKLKEMKPKFPRKAVFIDVQKPGGTAYGENISIGIKTVAEVAKREGWQFVIKDLEEFGLRRAYGLKITVPHLLKTSQREIEEADLVGITSTSPSHWAAIRIAETIAAMNPKAMIVKGGVHETYAAEYLQNKSEYPVDISFVGEADLSFRLLLRAIQERGELRGIPGICFKDETGRVIKTTSRIERVAPESFVLPSPELVDREAAFALLDKGNFEEGLAIPTQMVRVQSMRGCGFGCEFCAIKGKSRRVEPESFVKYLDAVLRAKGTDTVFFEDALFTIESHPAFSTLRRWTSDFAQEVRKRIPQLRFGIQSRSDCMDEKTIKMLYDAGCRSAYVGVETLSNATLRSINKALEAEAQIRAIEAIQKGGIRITASLICDIGTDQDFRRTVETLDRLEVAEVFMEAEKVFPGTKIAQGKEEEVFRFYDQPQSISTDNREDNDSFLIREIGLINERYAMAKAILESNYYKREMGHWIRNS